jgi:lipopolysaccharide transport system permease protein
MAAEAHDRRREETITPPSGFALPNLAEIWRRRDLLWALTMADIRSRYRQTVLGFVWNLLQPLLATIVFSTIFGQLGGFPSEGLPYPLFFFTGFLIWQFFVKAIGLAVPSLASNAHLLAKVYFPRLIVLLFPILTALVELLFSAVVLGALFVYYGYFPSANVMLLPLTIGFAALASIAVAVWLAPLNVYLRDVQMALPSFIQLGFFVTPIVYSSSVISETWRWLIYFNPMAVAVEATRWALVGAPPPPLYGIGIASAVVLGLSVAGLILFQRTSLTMVDRL